MEVAGKILEILQWIEEALEVYCSVLVSFKAARRTLETLSRNVKAERLILGRTCKRLLNGIVPVSVIVPMLQGFSRSAWREHDGKVYLRLQQSSEVFQIYLTEMLQAATNLHTTLSIDDDGKVRSQHCLHAWLRRLLNEE